jgi:hypothetical protein
MSLRDFVITPTLFYGVAVAAAVGLLGGFAMKVGSQTEVRPDADRVQGSQYAEAAPIAWPTGKTPDYVIGTDFVAKPPTDAPPVADYAVADEPAAYEPVVWRAPPPAPVRAPAPADYAAVERRWASTGGDILDMRLPEDREDNPAEAGPELDEFPADLD